MKLLSNFNDFLHDTVNIDETRLETLDSRIELISSYLEGSPVIGDMFIDVIPQGSMAHGTIIKPFNGHEFDADVLLQLVPQEGWLAKDYIEEVYKAFRLSGSYRDRVTRKSRCVTVQYANDCHIDVVPFLELQDGEFSITNRNEGVDGTYEQSDPTGYTAWLDEKNRIANDNLIKVIRLLKWLRDYKQTFTCKSVVLNLIIAGRVNDINLISDSQYYADVPTTIVNLLEDVATYLDPYSTYMPRIEDPTLPGVDYNHRWDNDQYLNFRKMVKNYASKARAAYDESDRTKSIELWRELFGDQFASKVKALSDIRGRSDAPIRVADPGEEFIENMHDLQIDPSYRLKIKGVVVPKNGYRTYQLSHRGNRVDRHRSIRFSITKCTVPSGYEVKWKIKNHGAAAREAGCLRGEIVSGEAHVEPTQYRGRHYVECYIIKNDVCVARDRQPVIIT